MEYTDACIGIRAMLQVCVGRDLNKNTIFATFGALRKERGTAYQRN
jgi:hypothetical protein